MPMIGQNDNLGGIVFTATRVILILSLAIIAIPTVAPAQSTASASQPPGLKPLPYARRCESLVRCRHYQTERYLCPTWHVFLD
jgi:hypothetical protein